jgi:hypothetical protein
MIDKKVQGLVNSYVATVKDLNNLYAELQKEGVYIFQEFNNDGNVTQLNVRDIKQTVTYLDQPLVLTDEVQIKGSDD